MITIEQFVGPYALSFDWTHARRINAQRSLAAFQLLHGWMEDAGVTFRINPKTKSQVSGSGNGGFRPQACPIGAPKSNHKEGKALDWFDPDEVIDEWCMRNQPILQACGVWLEHPDATPGWSHWQSVPPHSGNRIFIP